MEIKVNDYVRTKEGYICKILKLNEPKYDDGYLDFNDIGSPRIYKLNVVKTSPRIIDLIEVGDYVNGELVQDIVKYEDDKFINTGFEHYRIEDIKSVLTKEMFEQIEYKIN